MVKAILVTLGMLAIGLIVWRLLQAQESGDERNGDGPTGSGQSPG